MDGMHLPVIEAINISKRFTEVEALKGVSLTVHKGDFFGLFGPNGAGKTTLLRILTGQILPDSGSATTAGVSSHDAMGVKHAVGIVPEAETPPSFMTAQELLELTCRIRRLNGVKERVDMWLAFFEMEDKTKPARVSDELYINELGETEVKEMWDRKFGEDVYGVFSSFVSIEYPEFVEFMTSVLPGLSDEFMVDYIRELRLNGEYQTVVWDTAPLGQTLALLETPALLGNHLKMAPRIYSKLRFGRNKKEPILDILKRWEMLSSENMNFLNGSREFIRNGERYLL